MEAKKNDYNQESDTSIMTDIKIKGIELRVQK